MNKNGEEMLKGLIERIDGVFHDAPTPRDAIFTNDMGLEILQCIFDVEAALSKETKLLPGVQSKINQLITRGRKADSLMDVKVPSMIKNHEFEWVLCEAKQLDRLIHNLKPRYTVLQLCDLKESVHRCENFLEAYKEIDLR